MSNAGQFTGVVTDQLVRLYDFDQIQADNFKKVIQQTIIDNSRQLDLKEIDFIEAINCNLTLRISEIDLGINSNDNSTFFCDLTRNSYENMINLIEPFCKKDNNSYQWLYDIDTPIEFLFSPGGQW
ncbi:MAG: hypothetical protein IPI65_02605 [Bacteroidetes bacterium]|nr:hypothetical protein [Bacteroidota bacterium]